MAMVTEKRVRFGVQTMVRYSKFCPKYSEAFLRLGQRKNLIQIHKNFPRLLFVSIHNENLTFIGVLNHTSLDNS